MSVWTIAAVTILAAGVGVTWLSVVGLVRCNDAFDRLQFPGLASLYGPLAIAIALSLAEGAGGSALRAWLIAAILIPTSGVLSHATARAEWLRRESLPENASRGEEAQHEVA
jgi:multisubunit Na+/H+ antiporter MnhG subunit